MKKQSNDNIFLFSKENWRIVFIGIGLILIGFLLMMGGKAKDPNVFNPDELYSFRRINLAPIIILLGFVLQIFAILKKPNVDETAISTEKIAEKPTKIKDKTSKIKDKNSSIKKELVESETSLDSKISGKKKKKKKSKRK